MTVKNGTAQSYDDDTKAKTLAMLVTDGLAATHNATGIPKATISDWAKAAGVPTSSPQATARAEAGAKASALSRRVRVEESKSRLTLTLAVIAELATKAELEILQKRNRDGMPVAELNQIVGARTRAIHDLQLLAGDATERTEALGTADDVKAMRDNLQQRLRVVR